MKRITKTEKYKKKLTIILLITLGVLLLISCISIYVYSQNNQKEQEQELIKRSPYTLEEIYKLTNDYNEFTKELKESYKYKEKSLGYVICHFYDFFNKTTPFPQVNVNFNTQTKKYNNTGKTEYLNYYQYMEKMEWIYKLEKEKKEFCEENKNETALQDCDFNYVIFAEQIVYLIKIEGDK